MRADSIKKVNDTYLKPTVERADTGKFVSMPQFLVPVKPNVSNIPYVSSMQPTIPHNLPTDTKPLARDPEADYGEMQPPPYMKRTGSEVKYEPLSKFEDKLFRDTVLNPNSAIKDADVIQTKSIIAGSTLVDNDFRMNPLGPKKQMPREAFSLLRQTTVQNTEPKAQQAAAAPLNSNKPFQQIGNNYSFGNKQECHEHNHEHPNQPARSLVSRASAGPEVGQVLTPLYKRVFLGCPLWFWGLVGLFALIMIAIAWVKLSSRNYNGGCAYGTFPFHGLCIVCPLTSYWNGTHCKFNQTAYYAGSNIVAYNNGTNTTLQALFPATAGVTVAAIPPKHQSSDRSYVREHLQQNCKGIIHQGRCIECPQNSKWDGADCRNT